MTWLLFVGITCVALVTISAAPAQSEDDSKSSKKRFSKDGAGASLQDHTGPDEMVNWKTLFTKRRFPGSTSGSGKLLGNGMDDRQMVNWNRLFKKNKRALEYDGDQDFTVNDLKDSSMVDWNNMYTKRGFMAGKPRGQLAEQDGPDMVDWNSIYSKRKRGLLRAGPSLSNSLGGMGDPNMVDWTKLYTKRNFGSRNHLNDPNMINWDALYGIHKRQLPDGTDQSFNGGWRQHNMVNWNKVFSKRQMDKRQFESAEDPILGTGMDDFQNWAAFHRNYRAFDESPRVGFGLTKDLTPKQMTNWSLAFAKRETQDGQMDA